MSVQVTGTAGIIACNEKKCHTNMVVANCGARMCFNIYQGRLVHACVMKMTVWEKIVMAEEEGILIMKQPFIMLKLNEPGD